MANIDHTRAALEAAVETAIEALNALDGDTDAEPEETDHSSSEDDFDDNTRFPGSLCGARDKALQWDDEPDNDNEPSLGSLDVMHNQERWAEGGRRDLEGDEHDGREPDCDDEYSLGWSEFPRSEAPTHPMIGAAVDKED